MASFKITDHNYPIGPTKILLATTLDELRLGLNELHAQGFDLDIGWLGWDDGSVIAHCTKPNLHIQPEEVE